LLTGHCAHSIDCERWEAGCGQCPYLKIYPSIRKDGTANNWQRKRDIFSKSKIYIVSPSNWIDKKVEKSILMNGIVQKIVINNGVDIVRFKQLHNKIELRKKHSLPLNNFIVLVIGDYQNSGTAKNLNTLKKLLRYYSNDVVSNVHFLLIGKSFLKTSKKYWGSTILSNVSEENKLVEIYNSADCLVNISRVDTYPNIILEAMACGLPVISSAVGGIVEQVNGYEELENGLNNYPLKNATGMLVSENDALSIIKAIELLNSENVKDVLSQNSINKVLINNTLDKQLQKYRLFIEDVYNDFYNNYDNRMDHER